MRDLLIAVAFPLMLPAIAVLHMRHRAVRGSGAILGTIAGTAAVAVGLSGSADVDLRPAGTILIAMWWWTIGKMWVETDVMPRALGTLTAAMGAIAIPLGLFSAVNVGLSAVRPGFPDLAVWPIAELALAGWLLVLAIALWRRSAAVPSR